MLEKSVSGVTNMRIYDS